MHNEQDSFFSRLPEIHTEPWTSTALAQLSEMTTFTHKGIWAPRTTHYTSEYSPYFATMMKLNWE